MKMGRVPRDIILAPPGLNFPVAEAPRHGENPTTILAVGNIEERKGVIDAVMALDHAGLPSATLVLAGSDELEPAYVRKVRAFTERAGLSGRVRITGRLTDGELHGLYRSADAFMLLSRWEGYGMAIAEAMASGLPVVTTDVIDSRVVDGENGFVVPAEKPDVLGERLVDLLLDAPMRSRLSGQARKTALQYDWSAIADRILDDVLGPLVKKSET